MKSVLYVSSDVSNVHIELLNAIKRQGMNCSLLNYSISNKKTKKIDNIQTITYSKKTIWRGFLFYVFRLKNTAKKCFEKIKDLDIDILHGNMCSSDGYICRAISKKRKLPYVVSVRNTDMNLWFLWKIPWIKRMIYKNLFYAEKIIFLSESYLNDLLIRFSKKQSELIKSKCTVVPNGINDFWFENIFKKERNIGRSIEFITVGRIEENKNQLLVAKAINEIKNNYQCDFKYTIVGDCKDKKMLEELIKFDFVNVVPFKHKEELIDEFRHSDIYIMTSHFETFGLVYAEALTQGLPVIYSKGQGFDRQFEDGVVGYSANSNSVLDTSTAIKKTISNYNALSSNAIKLCNKFLWSSVISLLVKNYNESIESYSKTKYDLFI